MNARVNYLWELKCTRPIASKERTINKRPKRFLEFLFNFAKTSNFSRAGIKSNSSIVGLFSPSSGAIIDTNSCFGFKWVKSLETVEVSQDLSLNNTMRPCLSINSLLNKDMLS